MINKLKGNIEEIGTDYAVLDVAGVCYKLSCSTKTLSKLPPIAESCQILTELQIKDDQMILLGFQNEAERSSYKTLITVQGVGTKVAMAILSILSPTELSDAIIAQDKATIQRTPGIGPRVASRIITELKDRFYNALIAVSSQSNSSASPPDNQQATHLSCDDKDINDAISALSNLGYSRVQALNVIVIAKKNLNANNIKITTPTLIKEALKELANE